MGCDGLGWSGSGRGRCTVSAGTPFHHHQTAATVAATTATWQGGIRLPDIASPAPSKFSRPDDIQGIQKRQGERE